MSPFLTTRSGSLEKRRVVLILNYLWFSGRLPHDDWLKGHYLFGFSSQGNIIKILNGIKRIL
jgi:hypothetical protein